MIFKTFRYIAAKIKFFCCFTISNSINWIYKIRADPKASPNIYMNNMTTASYRSSGSGIPHLRRGDSAHPSNRE